MNNYQKGLINKIGDLQIGLEIEDHEEYTDEVESILDRQGIDYSTGWESDKIKEIRFMLTFDKMMSLMPLFLESFEYDHPDGEDDDYAGSMHVHLDVGGKIPKREDYKTKKDIKQFFKIADLIEDMNIYMKRNTRFRDAVVDYRSEVYNDYLYDEITRRVKGGHLGHLSGTKSYSCCYNFASNKPETFEIRLNEIFPLWLPLFFLRLHDISTPEAFSMMKESGDANLKKSYKYCYQIYKNRGYINNISHMNDVI